MGAIVFEGRHDMASNLVEASTVPVCFWTTTPEGQNGFVGRLSARNLVIGLEGQFDRPRGGRPAPRNAFFAKSLVRKRPWTAFPGCCGAKAASAIRRGGVSPIRAIFLSLYFRPPWPLSPLAPDSGPPGQGHP